MSSEGLIVKQSYGRTPLEWDEGKGENHGVESEPSPG